MDALLRVIEAFADAVAEAMQHLDLPTTLHSRDTESYIDAWATALGQSLEERRILRAGARVHDVGKLCQAPAIIASRGRLLAPDSPEMRAIRRHAKDGACLLRSLTARYIPGPKPGSPAHTIILMAQHHHENWAGDGYPSGLAGLEIPRAARMVRIVDSYAAMTQPERPQPHLSMEDALAEIERGIGRQYDPDLAASFTAVMRLGEVRLQECPPDPLDPS